VVAAAIPVAAAAAFAAAALTGGFRLQSAVPAAPVVGSPSADVSPVGESPSPIPSPDRSPSPSGSPQVVLPTQAEIAVASRQVLWVGIGGVAGQLLFHSQNQGSTWTQATLPREGGQNPAGLTFADATRGWLASVGSPATQCTGQDVAIWRTVDGAATWQNLGSKGIDLARCKGDLSFVDGRNGFLSASDRNTRPVIYRTQDAGASWAASAPLPDPPGYVTGGGGDLNLTPGRVQRFGSQLLVSATGWQHLFVYRSTDGGATWSHLVTLAGLDGNAQLSFMDANRWWMTGPGLGPENLYTTDAGRHVGPAPGAPGSAAPIPPVFTFADASVGFATVRGQIWKTLDGGVHWLDVGTPGT
jgi:photosystem II stability/assembly factor-like uncharacterized protein